MIRRIISIALAASVVLLIVVLLLIQFGDMMFRRTTPGMRLTYDVHFSPAASSAAKHELLEETAAALKRRVDPQGVREIQFRPAGEDQIEIFMPDLAEVGQLKRLVRGSGALEFYVLVANLEEQGAVEMMERNLRPGDPFSPREGDTLRWLRCDAPIGGVNTRDNTGQNYVLAHATPARCMTHNDPARRWAIRSAYAVFDQDQNMVGFELDDAGAALFSELTANNIGRELAIVLDGTVLSAPRVNSRIGVRGMISGGGSGFTQSEVTYLVNVLNAGALPAPLADEPAGQERVILTLGMAPATRFVLKAAACVVGVNAAGLSIAWLLTRPRHRAVAPIPQHAH